MCGRDPRALGLIPILSFLPSIEIAILGENKNLPASASPNPSGDPCRTAPIAGVRRDMWWRFKHTSPVIGARTHHPASLGGSSDRTTHSTATSRPPPPSPPRALHLSPPPPQPAPHGMALAQRIAPHHSTAPKLQHTKSVAGCITILSHRMALPLPPPVLRLRLSLPSHTRTHTQNSHMRVHMPMHVPRSGQKNLKFQREKRKETPENSSPPCPCVLHRDRISALG